MSYNSSYHSSPSPDQGVPSTVFPDRLIRPLPKRTLKSRLSLEAAESIEYPPSLPSSSLPNYAYGESGEYLSDSKVLVQNDEGYGERDYYHGHEHDEDHCPHHHHHHCHHDDDDDEIDSLDDASPIALRASSAQRSPPRSPRSSRHARYGSHGARDSVSGPDGYEAFENTNNKKKRKIPTSGSLSLHHSSLTNELPQLGINPDRDGHLDDYTGPNTAGSSGLGVQGAGRGHYARKSAHRRPLGVSVNGSNIRSGTAKYDQNMAATAKAEDSKDQGIISAAIANATALLRKPLGKGQENVGVLDQQSKQVAANSQFTFTCESENKGLTFPEQSLYSSSYAQRNGHLPPPPGTSPSAQRSPHPQNPSSAIAGPQHAQQAAPPVDPSANTAPRKPRRRRSDVYRLAARQRKLQQEYANIQHAPAPEDIWICEFCEYESIFGTQPRALIRQYEIKDRKERRRLAEKKRLLDKARRRGKKAAKSSKNNKNANAARNAGQQQDYEQPLDQLGDDDLDYPYDEDPEPISEAPPAPVREPATASHNATGKGGGPGDGGSI